VLKACRASHSALSRELTVVFAVHLEFMILVMGCANRLLKPAELAAAAREALAGRWPRGRRPPL
jgi:hypothetical protein